MDGIEELVCNLLNLKCYQKARMAWNPARPKFSSLEDFEGYGMTRYSTINYLGMAARAMDEAFGVMHQYEHDLANGTANATKQKLFFFDFRRHVYSFFSLCMSALDTHAYELAGIASGYVGPEKLGRLDFNTPELREKHLRQVPSLETIHVAFWCSAKPGLTPANPSVAQRAWLQLHGFRNLISHNRIFWHVGAIDPIKGLQVHLLRHDLTIKEFMDIQSSAVTIDSTHTVGDVDPFLKGILKEVETYLEKSWETIATEMLKPKAVQAVRTT